MKKIVILLILLLPVAHLVTAIYGQTLSFDFDMSKPQPCYNDDIGFGYDRGTSAVSKKHNLPMFFSVKVPEGDYKVTVTIGSRQYAGITALRAETRRMVVERMTTQKVSYGMQRLT